MNQFHPFHIISPSPWPLLTGIMSINLLFRTILLITTKDTKTLFLVRGVLIIAIYSWWRDISREGSFQGYHSSKVIKGLQIGMLLFIVSEILFFFSFFWIFFHRRLAPNIELGTSWPPIGVSAINPFQVPLLNTIVLLSSGATVTWAHHRILKNINKESENGLALTIILGLYFTILQGWEYWDASYNFADSVYGASFFIATGFHGIHVIVGTAFLIVALLRFKIRIFSKTHHKGIEFAIWYWHFVDVVWLFLYTFLYWWSYFVINIKSIFNFQLKGLN